MGRINAGHIDRGLRLALGVLFGTMALAAAEGSIFVIVGTVLAVSMFATAAVGFCPLYALLDLDTRPAGGELRRPVPRAGVSAEG